MTKLGLVLVCTLATQASAAPTGALDLDLTQKGSAYVLRDDSYEITFPNKPEVTATDTPANGTTFKNASAIYESGTDVYGFFMVPIPKGVPYDVKKGIDGARDGALQNVNGKIVKEDDAVVGGLKGRHTLGKANIQGTDYV